MTEVEVLKAFEYGGKKFDPGETAELPGPVADSVIEKGYGKEAVPSFGGPEGAESEGVSVEDYVKSGGWITPDDVSEGDVLEIVGPGRMDDRFEQEYLVVPVSFSGAEYDLRLGKRNTKRIADGYGGNTGRWVGKKVRVVSIEDYPGLGKKGLILKPAVHRSRLREGKVTKGAR